MEKVRNLFIKGQVNLLSAGEKIKNKLKEKKGLDGFVVTLIIIAAAVTIGLAFYSLSKNNIIDTSTDAFNKIKNILNN